MKIAEVIWDDAVMNHEFMSIEGIDDMKPERRSNVGYLTREDDACVVLSSGILYDGIERYDANMFITKGMIIKIRILEDD